MEHLRKRGWTVEGTLTDFRATFKDITMNYKDGDIDVWRGSDEIMRLRITDIL